MIGIIGHMSGGKTYTAVRLMLADLEAGHVVCSNVILKCRGVTSFLGVPCVVWKRNFYLLSESGAGYHGIPLSKYEDYPCGSPRGSSDYSKRTVSIYFDEVSSVFDSITHSSNSEIQRVAVWARHTEKRGQLLYLIMQFPSELHKRLRNHITEFISCVNSRNVRLPIIHARLPFFLRKYIILTRYLGDGETMSESSKWFPIDPRIYSCYDTGQMVFGSGFSSTSAFELDFTHRKIHSLGGVLCLLVLLQLLICVTFGVYCFTSF